MDRADPNVDRSHRIVGCHVRLRIAADSPSSPLIIPKSPTTRSPRATLGRNRHYKTMTTEELTQFKSLIETAYPFTCAYGLIEDKYYTQEEAALIKDLVQSVDGSINLVRSFEPTFKPKHSLIP